MRKPRTPVAKEEAPKPLVESDANEFLPRIVVRQEQADVPPTYASWVRAAASGGAMTLEFLHVDWARFSRFRQEGRHGDADEFAVPLLGRFALSNRTAGELAVRLLEEFLDNTTASQEDLRDVMRELGDILGRHGVLGRSTSEGDK